MTEATTHTLDVPGARLTYDVRTAAAAAPHAPPLLLIGSPMGAAGFRTLASHFPDRTVVTYDPRGVDRSTKADPATESTPDDHADDLSRLIGALGPGPVDLFATSGGAINAFALLARHPEQVRTLVAHEPPLAGLLPDREVAFAATSDIRETYLRSGFGPAMAKFIAVVNFEGPLPADYPSRPGPSPASFGLPTEDDGSRTDPLLGQNIITSTHYQPDFDALRRASTRIVVAVGTTSANALAGRGAKAAADLLGLTPVVFPGGHVGFSGGEYGRPEEPDAFAESLRLALADDASVAKPGAGN